VSLDETLAHCAELVTATPLPVSADLENGHAAAPDAVSRTIRLAAETGVAGASIEDTDLPGDGAYAFYLAVERVRAAAAAARALPRDFVLVARADGLMTGAYDLREAVARAQAFAEAGRGLRVRPDAPLTLAALAELCAARPVPVQRARGGTLARASLADLAAAGAARISLGSGLARLAHAALVEAARDVLASGRFDALARGAAARRSRRCSSAGARRLTARRPAPPQTTAGRPAPRRRRRR
jgi:2-methylisocitrate lyase-like PEP mutase family enzyme